MPGAGLGPVATPASDLAHEEGRVVDTFEINKWETTPRKKSAHCLLWAKRPNPRERKSMR